MTWLGKWILSLNTFFSTSIHLHTSMLRNVESGEVGLHILRIIFSQIFLYARILDKHTKRIATKKLRHNERDGVSNHQPHDCLLIIHRWPMNSPHKGPVTRKMFPFDNVIMIQQENTRSIKLIILPLRELFTLRITHYVRAAVFACKLSTRALFTVWGYFGLSYE